MPAFRLNKNQKDEFNSEYHKIFQSKKEVNQFRRTESVDKIIFQDHIPKTPEGLN